MAKLSVAHVYIHYFSNKNRYSTKLFFSEPNRQVSNHLGSIFGIIEIITPSRENSKIIEQLIGEIENTYYSYATTDSTFETAFEKTLKHINDFAISLISKDPAYSSGGLDRSSIKEKLNIAIGVIKDGEILLTVVNTVGAYLIHHNKQEYKIVDIVKQDSVADSGMLFDNVVSGAVSEGDYLFFCNNDISNFISKERIVKTVTSLSPVKAADYFKHSLLQHEGFNFAGLILHLEPEQTEEEMMPQSLASIGVLNASERATEKLLSPSLLPNLGQITGRFISSIKNFIREQFPTLPTKPKQKETYTPPAESTVKSFGINISPDKIKTVKEPSKAYSAFKDFFKKQSKTVSNKFESNFRAIKLQDRIRSAFSSLAAKINSIPNLSKILIGSFAVVLGIFLIITLAPHTPYSFVTGNNISDELLALEKTVNEGESKLIYNNRDEARTLITQAQQQLQTVKIRNNNEQQFANTLSGKIDRLVSQLRNITLVETQTPVISAIGAITPDIRAMIQVDSTLYYFDNANKTASSVDVGSHAVTAISGNFDSNVRSVKTDEKKAVYLLTELNHLYTIKGGKIVPVSLEIAPDDTIADFEFYNERLYTLIPNKNQIYRHPIVTGGYGSGVTWVQQSGINLSNAVSFKIDSSIWVLTSDGRIINLFKGAQKPFQIAAVEPPLTTGTILFKNSDQTKIFIFDQKNNRIVYIDTPAGTLLTQYYSPTLGDITSLTIDQNKKTAYVATGKDINSITLPEPRPQE